MRLLIPLLAVLLVVRPAASSQGQVPAPRPPSEVTLHELRSRSGKYLDQEVTFVVQFKACVESWPAYVSRFGPRDWVALAAWPDELFTWEVAVWENPATTLFVRRGTELEARVRAAREHGRYQVTGRVRESLLGQPRLEVQGFERLEGEVGQGTIVHVGRARELAFEGQFELALDQYQRAKAGPLPAHARAAIEKEVLEMREAQNEARAERKARMR